MAIVINEAFWMFFFMIGFVGTVDMINSFGPDAIKRVFHRDVSAAALLAGYLWLVLVVVAILRHDDTTSAMTASVLRNGALLYVATRIKKPQVHALMLVGVYLCYWPWWGYNVSEMLGLALVFGGLQLINQNRQWVSAKHWRYFVTIALMSVALWGLAAMIHHYDRWETLEVGVISILLLGVADLYDRLLRYRRKQTKTLTYGNNHDELTGVRSLALFRKDYQWFQSQLAAGHGDNLHLVMMDIDHFKAINDTYGHLIGDEALINFARDLQGYFIPMDYYAAVYRTGGEEFSILIFGLNDDQARLAIDNYYQRLKNLVVLRENPKLRLTVSAGISSIADAEVVLKDFIQRTDINLYAAKHRGRDQVVQTRSA
ncbi:GGDEF domain-containing protein [Lacticaseibacillus sp. N501-2]|uniref:GGDEF domain-containing protein n=1 Tax=Lacticaseibacillus salsurae TaxID=3367729 RepID=UPI0038B2C6F6